MQREQADAILVNLGSIMLRQCDELEELVDLTFEHCRVTARRQPAQARHRLRVTVVGSSLGAKSLHEFLAAEPLDQVVDRRERWIRGKLTLDTILLEHVAVPA